MDDNTETWSWAVLVSAFFCFFLTSVPYASGIMYIGIIEKYPESVTLTTWLVSVFHSIFYLLGPFGGFLVNSFSCRICLVFGSILMLIGFIFSAFAPNLYVLFFTLGIIAGAGISLSFFAGSVVLGYNFTKNRTLATGLALTGTAFGIVVYPPLIQVLNDFYGLNGMFMMIGAICFHLCICGVVIKPNKLEIERQKSAHIEKRINRHNTLNFKLCQAVHDMKHYVKFFKNPGMMMFCASSIMWGSAVNTCVVYLPDYYHKSGSSKIESSLMMSLFGFGSGVSRILMGMASVKDGVDPKILYFGSYGVIGMLTFFLVSMGKTFAGKIFYSISLGLYTGGTWALMSQISIDVVGFHDFASGMGLVFCSVGIGSISGPMFGSILLQRFGFESVLLYIGMLFVAASVFGLIMIVGIPKAILTQKSPTYSSEKIHINEADKMIDIINDNTIIVEDQYDK